MDLSFDQVTTFIGPNGSGKSTVLRALEWLFSGPKGSLGPQDLHFAAQDETIEVTANFTDLTDRDRAVLGSRYAPEGSTTFTLWRTADLRAGTDKMSGFARAFTPFEVVRQAQSATEKKACLNQAKQAHPELSLPKWESVAKTEAAMRTWELENPSYLTQATVSDSNFFGFNGSHALSEIFDYVFVSADLRASDEAIDRSDTIIGRIVRLAVDTTGYEKAVAELYDDFVRSQNRIGSETLGEQLSSLSIGFSEEVARFVVGRSVELRPEPSQVKLSPPKVQVDVVDASLRTGVAGQGHGFQRTLLVAALRVLASRGAGETNGPNVMLAIEEPELYQHPTQARALAGTLRGLASDASVPLQICYATHSPYFIDAPSFSQVRRVTRSSETGLVSIRQATIEEVVLRLQGFEDAKAIRRRFEGICLQYLPEALFADAVLLVEGTGDAAILRGATEGPGALAVQGIAVASVGSKSNMLIPHAILTQLGIPAACVVDNDHGVRNRMRGRDQLDIDNAEMQTISKNRDLCRYFGVPEVDFPVGQQSSSFYALRGNLEEVVATDWPEWEEQRSGLVQSGKGVAGKNSATYELAARACQTMPTGVLGQLLSLGGGSIEALDDGPVSSG